MATYTKTCTNAINVFGGSPTNKWGTATFGSRVWAFDDQRIVVSFGKTVTNTISFDNTLLKNTFKNITNTLVVSGDMSNERRGDSAGYLYVWGSSTNAEARPATSFTTISDTAATYVQISDTSTSWSQQ